MCCERYLFVERYVSSALLTIFCLSLQITELPSIILFLHFANSEDNGSHLWPRKLFLINYCISHKACPSFLLTPPPQPNNSKVV